LSETVFRVRLYSVEDQGAAYLGLSIHHLVLDGTAQQIVYGQLSQLLVAARSGQRVVLPSYEEARVVRDAISHHNQLGRLDRAGMLLPKFLHLELPSKRHPVAATDMQLLSCPVPEIVTARATDSAARNRVPLNALLLGTLATLLHARSGQDTFAVSQTYLGRRLDQLQAVGSFSTGVPMVFNFADEPSLLQTCQHVMEETVAVLKAGMSASGICYEQDAVGVCYELNDARSIPRVRSTTARHPVKVKLVDLFFIVNEHSDGYVVLVWYDAGVYTSECVLELMAEWMGMWAGGL
jgi:hypothetical protein